MKDQPEGSREQRQAQPTTPPPVPIPSTNPPSVPPIGGQGAAPPSGDETPRNQPSPPEDKFTKNDKVMMWLTGVIAFGTLVSAVAIGFQWHEMHEGGKDTTTIAEAAKKQVCAANSFATSAEGINTEIGTAEGDFAKMAKNSEGSIKATQEAMRQDQRAWIGMLQVTGIPEVGKPFHATITLGNSGRTPATDLVVQERLIPLNHGDKFVPNWKAKAPGIHSRIVLFPNQIYNSVVKGSDDDVVVDQSVLDTILNTGKIRAYVFGRACYKDVFKRKHWLHFCDVYDPEGKTYIACAEYNEVDTDKTANAESCDLPKSPS